MNEYIPPGHNDNGHAATWAGRSVVVTGGAGLIGSRIVQRLCRAGARVHALDHLDAYEPGVLDLFGVDLADPCLTIADIRDRIAVRRLVANADVVVHAAAYADVAACTTDPQAAFESNIHGMQVVLDEVARAPRLHRFVYLSSASVYGDRTPAAEEPVRFSETDPVAPISVYANAKQWGEHQTRMLLDATGVDYTILRLFSVYGHPQVPKKNSHSWAVAWLAMRAMAGLPLWLHGGGTQVRDFVHVDDIAEATLRAAASPAAAAQTINVGTGKPTSIQRIAELITPHFPDVRTTATPRPPGDPLGGRADTHRLNTILGWKPRITVSEGVEAYVRWLKAHPEAVPEWLTPEPSELQP